MVKKRIIFTLLYSNGNFMLSRNFRLQKVGNLNWLNRHYNFRNIAFSIDELIMLDVSKNEREFASFCQHVKALGDQCFVPIAAGGGIRKEKDVETLLKSGADKIVLNTLLHEGDELVKKLISIYGSQCVIGSVDLKQLDGKLRVFINNGKKPLALSPKKYIEKVADLGVGEIYLNSMDKDGTGQGYLMEILEFITPSINTPIILAGGAGNYHHLYSGIQCSQVDAVATANLFNFVGNGLPYARQGLIENNVDLAIWDKEQEIKLKDYFKPNG